MSDVFELTVEVEPVIEDVFYIPPAETAETPIEEIPAELELAEGDFWCGPMTYFQILADPDYQAWVLATDALQHYLATGDFSVFEPWQV